MNIDKITISSYLGYESNLIINSIKNISPNNIEITTSSPFSLNQKSDHMQIAIIVDPIILIPYHCLRLFESKKRGLSFR